MFPARVLLAVALALTVAGVVRAADRGAQCAGVEDDARRLACYDEAFGRAVPATPAGHGELADAVTPPDAAAPTVAASAQATAGEFGRVDLRREEEQSQPVPESISGIVLRVERDQRDFHKVWLDNQQVWRQTEEASGLRIDVGDTVVIRRRVFGSHVMRTTDSNRSARVERVE
jgi:hypothetical protein